MVNSAPELLNTLGEISAYLGNPTNTSTSILTSLSNKANANETFFKSSIDNDVYLAIGNKRFSALGTTNNKLIFEIKDNFGNTITDNYYSALSLDLDPITKQISCRVPNSLFVNNVNVMNEIGLKVNTTDLSNYVLASSLSPYLKIRF